MPNPTSSVPLFLCSSLLSVFCRRVIVWYNIQHTRLDMDYTTTHKRTTPTNTHHPCMAFAGCVKRAIDISAKGRGDSHSLASIFFCCVPCCRVNDNGIIYRRYFFFCCCVSSRCALSCIHRNITSHHTRITIYIIFFFSLPIECCDSQMLFTIGVKESAVPHKG